MNSDIGLLLSVLLFKGASWVHHRPIVMLAKTKLTCSLSELMKPLLDKINALTVGYLFKNVTEWNQIEAQVRLPELTTKAQKWCLVHRRARPCSCAMWICTLCTHSWVNWLQETRIFITSFRPFGPGENPNIRRAEWWRIINIRLKFMVRSINNV